MYIKHGLFFSVKLTKESSLQVMRLCDDSAYCGMLASCLILDPTVVCGLGENADSEERRGLYAAA